MVVSGWVGLLVVVAVVEDRLAGDTLLPTSDGCDFPDSPGRPVPNVSSLHRLGIALPGGGALHLGVAVRMHGAQLLVLIFHPTGERVGNIVIVILLPLALHEQPGALHKLVHGHGGSLVFSQMLQDTSQVTRLCAPTWQATDQVQGVTRRSRPSPAPLARPLPRPPGSRVRDSQFLPHSPTVDPLEICVKLVA